MRAQYALGRNLRQRQFERKPSACGQSNEHVHAEFAPFAAHQIGNARLRDAESPGSLLLRPASGFHQQRRRRPIRSARKARTAASSGGKPMSRKTLALFPANERACLVHVLLPG